MKQTGSQVNQVLAKTPTLTENSSMYLVNLMLNAFDSKTILEQGLFLGGVPMSLHALNPERSLKFVTTENLVFSQHQGSRVHYQQILTNRKIDIDLSQFDSLETLGSWIDKYSQQTFGTSPDLAILPSLTAVKKLDTAFDFIHMDCTDDYDLAVERIEFMLTMLNPSGIFCVDDFNSAEGFMRALAVGKFVRTQQLWPLACDLRKVYFTRSPNAVQHLVETLTPDDFTAYPEMEMQVRATAAHGRSCEFLIFRRKRFQPG